MSALLAAAWWLLYGTICTAVLVMAVFGLRGSR